MEALKKDDKVFYLFCVVGLVVFGFVLSSLFGGHKFGATTETTVSKLTVGSSGTSLSSIVNATSSIDWSVIEDGKCAVNTMTATGAVSDSTNPPSVALGIPVSMYTGYATSVTWTSWVSANDQVSIKGCQPASTTVMLDPPALVFSATVINR